MRYLKQWVRYWFLQVLGKRPLWYWEAEEKFEGEYAPGLGVYMSDGVYSSLSYWVRVNGFTPMWEDDNEFR